MQRFSELCAGRSPQKPAATDRNKLAADLGRGSVCDVYPESIVGLNGTLYAMGRRGTDKSVLRAAPDIDGSAVTLAGERVRVQVMPCTHGTADMLRQDAEFLRPRLIGTATSIGLGDRLGLATPGHLRAVGGTGVAPFVAQQSIREMERTGRTPDDVMDDALFGVLQSGWTEGFGSDADHVKTRADIDVTMAAGFTMFTVDPGDHVDNEADSYDESRLRERYESLPWSELETSAADTTARYVGRRIADIDPAPVFSERDLVRASVKYGRAVTHTVGMYRYIESCAAGRPVELEVSVDETATPTSTLEHYYVASELARLGVRWVSLAPRFVGRFEKGVDYIGDLHEFEQSYIEHCAVAASMGGYKLSIHSGSDKFSIYGICARHSNGRIHVKTAGTSYLTALKVVAGFDPDLLVQILAFARERYEQDKRSYHVSAEPAKVVQPEECAAADLPAVLDRFDTRQALHVTFGSVLTNTDFKRRIIAVLKEREEAHYQALQEHLHRHVEPLVQTGSTGITRAGQELA